MVDSRSYSWLIDYGEVEDAHVYKDPAKLEACFWFIYTTLPIPARALQRASARELRWWLTLPASVAEVLAERAKAHGTALTHEALPELLVARRRRLTMVYDTWRTNTQLLRKYRRIFMARIIRLNRQRLVRFFERWVDYLIDVRGDVAKGGDVESSFGMSAEDLAAQNRAEMEAVWAEKAAAKAAEKKRQIAERDRERKEAMARKRAAELKSFRDAAASRERELSEARAEAEAEKLREQEVRFNPI